MKEKLSYDELSDALFITAATQSPIWGNLQPDAYKAYCEFEICAAFPNVAGPELHGRVFGWHPQVLANSHQSLIHQQTNIGHTLKRYGGNQDRVNGAVVAVAFPDAPYGGWKVGASAEAAPRLRVLAVVHKALSGVPEWIGQHLGNKSKQSVSIEATADDMAVYDPLDGSIVSFEEALEKFPDAITQGKNGGHVIGKFENRQLAFAPGGSNGVVSFQGVGYTPTPAEKTAKINSLRAQDQTTTWLCSIATPEWDCGMPVSWKIVAQGDAGRGEIVEVIYEGVHKSFGVTMKADHLHPLLKVKPHGKNYTVLRSAASVKKMGQVA